MKVTKIVVTYFDGTTLTYSDWDNLNLNNAANIATIEETTLMSLSEVKSRYRFITLPADCAGNTSKASVESKEPKKIWTSLRYNGVSIDSITGQPLSDAESTMKSGNGHEPKGSMGS